ncbi:hypothetical protein MJH12_09920, partial [bacterium]|nr:hypothetical protein [bacterium]
KSNGFRNTVAPQDQVLVSRLSAEFRTELDLLGVRIDSLETRVLDVERKTNALDTALSNVHIEGFYQAEQEYIARSNQFVGFADPGLHKLNQDVFLKFIGNPKTGGSIFSKNVEAFLELKANISGVANNRLEYAFSSAPLAGDTIDDFATSINDERRVMVTKAHFRSSAPLMNVRVFSGEQITSLKDPAIMLTASNFKGDIQGIEASGKYKNLSYFTSVLKRISESSSTGGNDSDLFSLFRKETDNEDDVFSFRLNYTPYAIKDGGITKQLVFGTTYVEHATDYNTKNSFNRGIGWDAKYSREGNSSFDLSFVHMLSEGSGDVHGSGEKFDLQYENNSLITTLKLYSFDKDFKLDVGSNQIIDSGGDNYGRGATTGEKLARVNFKYTFEEGQLSVIDNLTMSFSGQNKWWEKLEGSENESWYGRNGTKLQLRTVLDFNDRTHVEMLNQLKKDARADEKGETVHQLDMDVRLNKEINAIGSVSFETDFDDVVDGQQFTRTDSSLSINAKVHPRLFLKGKVFDRVDWSGRPIQVDTDILDLEANYQLLKNVSFKQFLRRKTYSETANINNYTVTDYWVSEVNVNFSRKLEGRTFYAWQETQDIFRKPINNITSNGDDFWNWFAEVTYEPTKSTEVSLTYGYDYNDRSHPGRFSFENSRQKVTFKASTDF